MASLTTHRTQRTLSACLLTGLLAAAGLSAQAQSTPAAPAPAQPPTANMPMHEHGPGGAHMGHGNPEQMKAWRTRQQEALKAKLKLTPAQEGAWTSFTASMQPPAQGQDHAAQMADLAKLSTPERIDRMRTLRSQHMTEMNAQMDKRGEATKAFYAALTPEQQKVFDAETARMMQGGGPRGHGPHHGGMAPGRG